MPSKAPGTAAPRVAEAAVKSWHVFKYYNPGSARDPQLSYVSGYRRAVADMMADQFEFGGWDTLTRRLLEVFEDLAIQREAVRMVQEDLSDE